MRVLGLKAFTTAVAAAAVLSSSGCYVDDIDRRAPGEAGEGMSGDDKDAGHTTTGACRLSTTRGCFEGHVISKKGLSVDGKQFFDADDLVARFDELLTVQSLGVELKEGETYQLQLTTPVDNQSFVQGFEYDLTGETARGGKVGSQGNFLINDLPEGSYDLRVQRSVRFTAVEKLVEPAKPAEQTTVEEPRTAEPAQPQSQTEPAKQETVTKSFCATLYADAVLEVARGRRVRDTFGEFKLHVTDNECEAGGANAKLTLRK